MAIILLQVLGSSAEALVLIHHQVSYRAGVPPPPLCLAVPSLGSSLPAPELCMRIRTNPAG